LILGIDTATAVCVGLADGLRILAGVTAGDSRSHAELLAPTVQKVLTEAGVGLGDLAGVGVGYGPGPFTGLRVGVATALSLARVAGLPVYPVCSLDVIALAWGLSGQAGGRFIAALDARRKELYWAVYDAAGARTAGPSVSVPGDLPALPVVGPGGAIYPLAGAGAGVGAGAVGLDAGFLAAHVHDLPAVGPEPLYLRPADAQPGARSKSALTPQELTPHELTPQELGR